MENIALFANGDTLVRTEKALILTFAGTRQVISTCQWLGGLREDLKYIYNFDLKDKTGYCQIEEEDYSQALRAIAAKLGLNPQVTTGMTTAVSMTDMALVTKEAMSMSVTAVATAGIENNGGCAGDPGSYAEENGSFVDIPGTINIVVWCNVNMPPGTMVQALTTVVEAKASAVRDLELPSLYSQELATGSGTDGIVLVADPQSPLKRTDAGKHSLLGELLGKAVKEGVKQGLINHTAPANLNRDCQSRVLKRFGLTGEGFKDHLASNNFPVHAHEIWHLADSRPHCGALARIFAGLCDDLRHNAGEPQSIYQTAETILGVKAEPGDFQAMWYKYLLSHFKENN